MSWRTAGTRRPKNVDVAPCLRKNVEAHVTDAAVSKLVDDWSAEPLGNVIVDERTEVGTYCGEHHNEHEAHAAVGVHSLPCCRRNNHLRREGDERTLDSHKQYDNPIVEIVENPKEKFCCIHILYSFAFNDMLLYVRGQGQNAHTTCFYSFTLS